MTPMFDQSQFLAARKDWAWQMDPPPQFAMAMQGARAPIARDRLEALQDTGLTEHEIVKRVNEAHARNA